MRELTVDIETYSSADLSDTGVYAYTEAPDFEILLIGYAWDDEPAHVIDLSEEWSCSVNTIIDALTDPDVLKIAHNAQFERACFERFLCKPMPPEQWLDTMVCALELGLPASLAAAGSALGLPEDLAKDTKGKALIRYFSKPCQPTKANGGRTRNLPKHDPEKWKLYVEYNRQDVVSEREILNRLRKYKIAQTEWQLWQLDQGINDRGVRIDLAMAQKIVTWNDRYKIRLQDEARRITGLANPNSLAQLKPWINAQGVKTESLTKDNVTALLKQDLPGDVRRILEIRQALGKTSTAKYQAMLDATCQDGRLRGTLQFYGAGRTGRWAGRLVQTHNLARNSLPDLDLAHRMVQDGNLDDLECFFGEPTAVLSELIRTAFIPSTGNRFIVSDFSAIEARVLAWLAGEEWVLDAFRSGKDIYCETASMMYHVPVVKHGENGHLRSKGKVAVLACGYQGGVGAMRRMDREGVIPEEELQSVVDQWRSANPRIVKLWRIVETAAKKTIQDHRSSLRPSGSRGLLFRYDNGALRIQLPSGREITYWGARIKQDPFDSNESIVFMTVNTARQWAEEETYGGKLVENITQAIARDCLAETIRRVTAAGYQIVMHVHDEIIVDAPRSDTNALETITGLMSEPVSWAPDLPLKGDGYACDYYRKD